MTDNAEKNKAAVQKMLGAKAAMESTLAYVSDLENELRIAKAALETIKAGVGQKIWISAYIPKESRNGQLNLWDFATHHIDRIEKATP